MRARLKVAAIAAGSLAAGSLTGTLTASGQPTELWFLDVGQGDCAVFRHAGVTVLIDAGPAAPDRDTAAQGIIRDLRRMGVTAVDLVLLSHPDADHVGGLRGIARHIPVRKVGAMAHFASSSDLGYWLREARIDESRVAWLSPGSRIEFGSFRIEVDSVRFAQGDPDNFGSMFLRVEGGTAAADFSGDADAIAEAVLSGRRNWRAQVLKAGHHGSRTSTSEAWLRAVEPNTVVFSCGRHNSYGHPSKEALARVTSAGATAVRTDQEGDIRFELRNGAFVRVR
ncbi:MAG: MBL fold metallo-hydrolase [Armatimonadetes bacterium]|nr:MBL fold metallo-hydrolase [Armatimonadota bacterium]